VFPDLGLPNTATESSWKLPFDVRICDFGYGYRNLNFVLGPNGYQHLVPRPRLPHTNLQNPQNTPVDVYLPFSRSLLMTKLRARTKRTPPSLPHVAPLHSRQRSSIISNLKWPAFLTEEEEEEQFTESIASQPYCGFGATAPAKNSALPRLQKICWMWAALVRCFTIILTTTIGIQQSGRPPQMCTSHYSFALVCRSNGSENVKIWSWSENLEHRVEHSRADLNLGEARRAKSFGHLIC